MAIDSVTVGDRVLHKDEQHPMGVVKTVFELDAQGRVLVGTAREDAVWVSLDDVDEVMLDR